MTTTARARTFASATAILSLVACTLFASIPAFPGAEGFGAETRGGRGGQVLEVTNLDADGPGSLKAAIDTKGPRIVVFRVGGAIRLTRGLSIREPFITIAGQTAPGDGICLRGARVVVSTHDVVIRYLRIRVGDSPDGPDPGNRDAFTVVGDADNVYNVIADHCSFSWSTDETVNTWGNPQNVTLQWCIISEGLLDSLHPQGSHSMGILIGSVEPTATVHHCLLAHNNGRNPLISARDGTAVVDWRNNVIYNYGRSSVGSVNGSNHVNYVNNFIRAGQNGRSPGTLRIDADAGQRYFVAGNVWPGAETDGAEAWRALSLRDTSPRDHLLAPEPFVTPPVDTQSATDAYESVLRFAGATRPVRDVVDDRIVEEIRAGTGRVIDSQREVGGWPVYLSADAPTDSDHDGMPDDWEREYGMTPDDAEDGRADLDGDGYTNVEEYLNATDPTRNTSGGPSVQSEPFVQKGNDALRFGVARTAQEWTPHDPAARSAFVDAVEASGQEVGDYVGLDFTRLPAGDFVKGYSGANITVTLTKAFEMATYEVTQGQWTAVMGGKPWLDREWAQDAPENAATYVSWHDCQEFVARLNACGDREYRLPTEAELDYASRAGHDGTAMFWLSDEQIGDHAWYGRNTVRAGEKYAHPVGRKEPSPWGVHDLAGNALEWCYDRFEYWYWGRGETKTDPMGPEGDASIRDYYVVRGGSFYYSARLIRTEYDRSNDIDPSKAHRATYRNFDVGFRVVRVSP